MFITVRETPSWGQPGLPLKRRTAPLVRRVCHPPQVKFARPFFTLHHASWLQKKDPKSSKAMSNVIYEGSLSSLHAPIYRNFYMCVRKKKVKHFDVERPVKFCALKQVCPMHRRRNYSANSVCKFCMKIRGFPPETPTIRVVYRRSSRFYNLTNTFLYFIIIL